MLQVVRLADLLDVSVATGTGNACWIQYIGKQVSYDKGTTVTLADDTLIPFIVAYRHYPRDPIIRQVLSRAASCNHNCVPFSRIDSFHIDRLVDISEFEEPADTAKSVAPQKRSR